MRTQSVLRAVPALPTSLRLGLVPVVVVATIFRWPGAVFIVCLILAFVSDIYDGKIARRLGVATPALRRFDSLTDVAFYLAVLFGAWMLHGDLLRKYVWVILFVVLLDLTGHAVSFIRFGRPAAAHCYSAKVGGILLFAAFVNLLGFGRGGWLLWLTIGWGGMADLEALAVIVMAPTWPSDGGSIFHARRLWRTGARFV